jgi:acyl-CoA thioesterase FadM
MHYIGFNSGEFARAGNALALSECNVKYTRPLRTRDTFNSKAWVTKVSATSFHLYQELVKVEEDEQACKEEVKFMSQCYVLVRSIECNSCMSCLLHVLFDLFACCPV